MAKPVKAIVVYEVWTGHDAGTYDAGAVYPTWRAAVTDIKAALDHRRDVLIKCSLMTEVEFDALDDSGTQDTLRRLRGEPVAPDAVDPVDGNGTEGATRV